MTDKHLSTQFDNELSGISTRVLEMGGLVESQVAQAVHALANFHGEGATLVLKTEERVNAMEVEIDREVEGIAEVTVLLPFGVAAEVGGAGLDFDAGEAAVGAQCEDIGAAAVGEGDFVERGPAVLQAQTRGGAANGGGAFNRGRGRSGGHAMRSIAAARARSRLLRPPASWVVRVISTRFQTLNHSG